MEQRPGPQKTAAYYEQRILEMEQHLETLTRDKVQAEQEAERYRSMFNNLQDIYYEASLDGIFLEISPSVEIISGGLVTRKQLIGHPLVDFYADPTARDDFFRTVFNTGNVSDYEINIRLAEGFVVPVSISSRIVFDDHGKPSKVAGTIRDITHRKKLESDLRQSKSDLEDQVLGRTQDYIDLSNLNNAIVDNAGFAIITTDTKGQILTLNPAAEQLTGYSAEEAIGKMDPVLFFDPEEFRDFAERISANIILPQEEQYRFLMDHLRNTTSDWTLRRKNGTAVSIKLNIAPWRNADNEIKGYIGLAIDITREKEALDILMKSRELFRNMFEEHDAVMMLVNPATREIVEVNEAAKKFYGYDFDGDQKILVDQISTLPKEVILEHLNLGLFRIRNTYVFNDRLASGELRTVEVHSSPIELRGQKLLFSIVQDITDRVKAEELLKKSEAENRAILEAVPDLYFRLSRDGVFLGTYSRQTSSLYAPPEVFLGKKIGDVLPPYLAAKATEAMAQSFASGETVSFEYELEMHGELRFYEDRIMAIGPDEALSIIRDITERVKAEKALRWNESLLNLMAAASPLAFLVVDNATDDILYINHRFCAIWGIEQLEERISRKELKNNDIIPFCIPKLLDVPAFAESCKPLQDINNRAVIEDVIPFNDGKTIRRFSTQIRTPEDEYYGRLYIFEDITERVSAEKLIVTQRNLAEGLSRTTDLNQALNLTLEALLLIEGIDGGAIYLADPASHMMKLRVHTGLADAFIHHVQELHPAPEHQQQILSGHPLYSTLEQVLRGLIPEADSDNIMGVAVLPIMHEGHVIGSVNLASRSMIAFSPAIRSQVEALVHQVQGAIARLHAESSLVASQRNFSSLFNTINDFIFIIALDGTILRTNLTVERRLGYSADELTGMLVTDLHPPARREEAACIVGEMIAGASTSCHVPLWTRDGREIPAETFVIKGIWDDREVLYGISRDITIRLQMEEALRESELRWSFALEGSGDGVWDWDAKTNEVFFSRQWKAMLGFNEDEIGSHLSEWESRVHPDDLASSYAALDKHIQGEEPVYVNEHRMRCKDGSYKWILDRGTVITRAPDGRPLRLIGTHTDITQRKIMEHSLMETIEKEKELNELKSKFISVATHEFRTPLATILASTDTLMTYWDRMPQEQREQKFDKINEQVGHLNRYIEEMLQLTRLQTREKQVEPERFDMSAFLRELVDELGTIAENHDRIELSTPDGPMEVFLDKKEFRIIANNLIINALKYSKPETSVTVKLFGSTSGITLTVTDRGIGIPEKEIPHLFEPFFRATNTANIPGTGLGLNIVRESVERHGGNLEIKSRLGAGTTIKVSLPLVFGENPS